MRKVLAAAGAALALIAGLATPARAANPTWASGPGRFTILQSTVEHDDPYVFFTMESRPLPGKAAVWRSRMVVPSMVAIVRTDVQLDCDDDTFRTLGTVLYNDRGRYVASNDDQGEWDDATAPQVLALCAGYVPTPTTAPGAAYRDAAGMWADAIIRDESNGAPASARSALVDLGAALCALYAANGSTTQMTNQLQLAGLRFPFSAGSLLRTACGFGD